LTSSTSSTLTSNKISNKTTLISSFVRLYSRGTVRSLAIPVRSLENETREQGFQKFKLFVSSAIILLGLKAGYIFAADEKEVKTADDLYDQGKTAELHSFLKNAVSNSPNDANLLWRYARACHDLSLLENDKEKKKALVYEAYENAKKAIDKDKNNFACHKWAGITLSSIGDYEGTKVKISNAFTIKEYFANAIALNDKDPTSHHLLGLWCFTFADMSWVMTKLAATLFATPPSSTYQEALDRFLFAENLEPNFYKKNTVMIGKTLQKMNKHNEAKLWLTKAVSLPINNPDDEAAHKEAQDLLKSL